MRDARRAIDTLRQHWGNDYRCSYSTIPCTEVRYGLAMTYMAELAAAIRGLSDDI